MRDVLKQSVSSRQAPSRDVPAVVPSRGAGDRRPARKEGEELLNATISASRLALLRQTTHRHTSRYTHTTAALHASLLGPVSAPDSPTCAPRLSTRLAHLACSRLASHFALPSSVSSSIDRPISASVTALNSLKVCCRACLLYAARSSSRRRAADSSSYLRTSTRGKAIRTVAQRSARLMDRMGNECLGRCIHLHAV